MSGKSIEARIRVLERLKSQLPAAKVLTFHQTKDGKYSVAGTDLLFSKKERDKYIKRERKRLFKRQRPVVAIVYGKRGTRPE